MQFSCLVCGIKCKLRKGEAVSAQLREWQRECPSQMDDDGLNWILSLDISSLDKDQCVCGTCGRLLSDLAGYEALADGVRSELLHRHTAGRQGETLKDDDPYETEPTTPQLRRSGRLSGGAGAPRSAPPAAAPGQERRRGLRLRRGPHPLSVVQVTTEPAGPASPPADTAAPSGRRSRRSDGGDTGRQAEVWTATDEDGDGEDVPAVEEDRDIEGESEEAVRENAALEIDVKEDDTSDDVVPEDGVAEDAAPEDCVTEDTIPEDDVTEHAVPEDAGSEDAPSGDDRDCEEDGSSVGGPPSDSGRDADYQPRPPKPALSLTCNHCGLEFKSRAGLAAHRRRSHRDTNGANTCAICRKTFKHRGSLITHRRMVHGKGERCRQCDAVFRDFMEYYRHLSDAHGIKGYVCEHCGAGFSRRVLLNKHLRKEERKIKRAQLMERLRVLQCSVCDYRPVLKSFCRAATVHSMIRDHEHRSHGLHGAVVTDPESAAGGGVSAAPPPGGSGVAATAAAADDFITLTVSGEVAPSVVPEQRLHCAECGQVFGCRSALAKHKRLHVKEKKEPVEPVVVQCEYCGKEFASSYLKTHQESVHKIADPKLFHTCQYCGKQYHKYQKHHYISHVQNKHLMDKQYICTEADCGRSFLHQRGLLRHVRTVHQRSVTCGACPERFGSLWKRDKHRAEVHGQYDFICSDCGLKFFRRAELEIHTRRVHTLQLKYQCVVCSHRSEERRKLLNHEHSQHGLHAQPLPENNPAGQLGYPCPACRVVYGCGLVVKQHAWEAHQIKLNIYGKPKTPLSKLRRVDSALASDVISQTLQ